MPAEGAIRVDGLIELNRALRRTSKDMRLGIRKELGSVAEPIRADAEALAVRSIRNVGLKWARMRVGQTSSLVYVAPRERGRLGRRNANLKRPNMAGLLMGKAMQPALDRHANEIERELGDVLDRVANTFSR